jgi:hypothetical protein
MSRLNKIIERYEPSLDLFPNGFNHHSGNEDIGHEIADKIFTSKSRIHNDSAGIDKIERYKKAINKFPARVIYFNRSGMRSRLVRIFRALEKEKFPNLDYKNKTTSQLWNYYNHLRKDLGRIK